MNIAILGSDPALLSLVKLIAGSTDHQLTHICETDELAAEIMLLVPSVVQLASWEDLLQLTSLKMVIVAGAKDNVLTGAKQLATAEVPLMLLPATAQDSVFIYELSLIQDANHITLLPYLPLLDNPVIKQLREQLASEKMGQVLHLQWERTCNTPTHLLTQKDIERMLLHDVALLRNVWGDYNQITALYSAMTFPEETSDQFSMATITLAGAKSPEVVWRLKPSTTTPTAKLTITTSQGEIVLEQNGTDENWLMRDGNARVIEREDQTGFVVPSLHALLYPEETAVSWGELIRSFETVDATRRSIKRRRTIDLHFETTSERSIFKTQMTAIGCSLLVITLFLFVVVLMVGNLFHPANWVMQILRGAIFLPLFVFLAMQLFLFMTRPASQG